MIDNLAGGMGVTRVTGTTGDGTTGLTKTGPTGATGTVRTPTSGYLHVTPQYENGVPAQRWNIYQLQDVSPRITLVASITSYEEALQLAAQAHTQLRIAERAWQQMLAAGVAPNKPAMNVTIT